jgi:hypothetical protein
MRRFIAIISIAAFIAASLVALDSALAVKPPTVKERKAATTPEKHVKKSCPQGKDVLTGECVKPKEGQFYRDSRTGKAHMKKIDKVNLPWDQKK